MGAQTDMMLAGAVQNFGNSWSNTLLTWVTNGLMIALGAILIIHAIRKMSIKAAIGGAIGLVICWSIFSGRYSIANMFQSEYKDPGTQATTPGSFQGARELPAVFTGRL